ncbi:hypothetical protein [Geodermatophilus amargosae]|uniref:hypothetical protein n=1 Tax=Geodermatophilus amargosae TaxID=1296565 RepID=UPI0034DFEBB5
MTTPVLADVPVRSPRALTRRWASLLQPLVFDTRSLWLAWIGPDGRQSPALVPIDDVPARPDLRLVSGLLGVHDEVAASLGSNDVLLAMALCRPGEPVETGDDTDWLRAFHEVLGVELDQAWSLHLAAGGRVEPLLEAQYFLGQVARSTDGPR